jgi:hypothetical protein
MFFRQAEDAVAQDEAYGDVGIGAEELGQDWHESARPGPSLSSRTITEILKNVEVSESTGATGGRPRPAPLTLDRLKPAMVWPGPP